MEFLRHLLRISTGRAALLFDGDLEEFGAEGLYLLSRGGTRVKPSDDASESPGLFTGIE